ARLHPDGARPARCVTRRQHGRLRGDAGGRTGGVSMRSFLWLVLLLGGVAGCSRHEVEPANATAAERTITPAQLSFRKFAPATAELDRARAALERLHLTPGEPTSGYLLRAPLAGTVVERRAAVGMETGAESGDPLVVVSDLSRVRVNLRLPERQLGLVDRGQP